VIFNINLSVIFNVKFQAIDSLRLCALRRLFLWELHGSMAIDNALDYVILFFRHCIGSSEGALEGISSD